MPLLEARFINLPFAVHHRQNRKNDANPRDDDEAQNEVDDADGDSALNGVWNSKHVVLVTLRCENQRLDETRTGRSMGENRVNVRFLRSTSRSCADDERLFEHSRNRKP